MRCSVCGIVKPQFFVVSEALPAQCAEMRRLTKLVAIYVLPEFIVNLESFPANVTAVWFLSSVANDVSFEVLRIGEYLSAERAGVRPLPIVGQRVLPQLGSDAEPFPADTAHMWFLTSM